MDWDSAKGEVRESSVVNVVVGSERVWVMMRNFDVWRVRVVGRLIGKDGDKLLLEGEVVEVEVRADEGDTGLELGVGFVEQGVEVVVVSQGQGSMSPTIEIMRVSRRRFLARRPIEGSIDLRRNILGSYEVS